MKIIFAKMKFNFALVKVNFAVLRFNFAVEKFNFALVKLNLPAHYCRVILFYTVGVVHERFRSDCFDGINCHLLQCSHYLLCYAPGSSRLHSYKLLHSLPEIYFSVALEWAPHQFYEIQQVEVWSRTKQLHIVIFCHQIVQFRMGRDIGYDESG